MTDIVEHRLADALTAVIAGIALGLALVARWRVRDLERTTRELEERARALQRDME